MKHTNSTTLKEEKGKNIYLVTNTYPHLTVRNKTNNITKLNGKTKNGEATLVYCNFLCLD